MKFFPPLLFILIAFVSTSFAETAQVAVRLPEGKAWTGQRLPFFIELRAAGTFSGAASFDIPQLPGTIIIKIGAPVVSSKDIDGKSWFIQEHEFALFSQKSGVVEIPQFPVRYAARSGFTGPASDIAATFPGMKVTIERPPGSDNVSFLITTESLEVTESWIPEPGAVQAGAIFKRKIIQKASQLSGMALAPAPDEAPEGIKVYSEDAIVEDKTERGYFTGERSDTVTYQMNNAGSFTLPELTYTWWNPKTEKMEKTILPSVSFTVSPAPSSMSPAGNRFTVSLYWILVSVFLIIFGIFAIWQRKMITTRLQVLWKVLHPADKVLAKKLLRACRENDAAAAGELWILWRNTQGAVFNPGVGLQESVLDLQRHLFGKQPSGLWQGEDLSMSFIQHINTAKNKTIGRKASVLPKLNG